MSLHLLNVGTHVLAGGLGLAVGFVVLTAAKGERLHRRAGRIFVALAAIVLTTAVIGDVFFDPPAALVAATLAAGYQCAGSLRALHLRDRGPGLVDAVMAIAGLGACGALLIVMGPGTASWSPAIGYSTIGYVGALAVYDLSRHAWRDAWRAHVRPLDHGLKMAGAYFAMMSAGVGNIFRDLQPWSQVGPSALGGAVIVALAFAFLRRGRRGAAADRLGVAE